MITVNEIPKPQGRGRLSTHEILNGQIIPAIDRLSSISEDEFEDLVLEWVDGYLTKKYHRVREFGGSGDKGRDVVGYYENGEIDFYQCKHYSSPLSPAQIWIELGKIAFYTFNGDYKTPKSYFFVTTKGVGPKLLDLIDNPSKFNSELLKEWDDKCRDKIKASKTFLTKDLKEHIEKFDFSIVKDKSPLELINEHKTTSYYPQRFGGGLVKYREIIPNPSQELQPHELIYTKLLFQAYSKLKNKVVENLVDLKNLDQELVSHFEEERKSFYCTESLEKFSRDNFADITSPPFEEMKEDCLMILRSILILSERDDDLERLQESKLGLMSKEFASNPLHSEIRHLDKAGMCHYLANQEKIKWEK
ncbi:ABC-three component system protein [Cyclobacterium marinum]|uniref:ABC-three component system protein n=1 Tax=Cyclobacterium marinum TaxID=104 RepID=UPI0011ED0F9E|nr:ABC-three component system protein [Cyclobacterium marinum]MBI0401124.1 hypothetical protein [Cyclobacterium marinum]